MTDQQPVLPSDLATLQTEANRQIREVSRLDTGFDNDLDYAKWENREPLPPCPECGGQAVAFMGPRYHLESCTAKRRIVLERLVVRP